MSVITSRDRPGMDCEEYPARRQTTVLYTHRLQQRVLADVADHGTGLRSARATNRG